jgi:hypothetical protein
MKNSGVFVLASVETSSLVVQVARAKKARPDEFFEKVTHSKILSALRLIRLKEKARKRVA